VGEDGRKEGILLTTPRCHVRQGTNTHKERQRVLWMFVVRMIGPGGGGGGRSRETLCSPSQEIVESWKKKSTIESSRERDRLVCDTENKGIGMTRCRGRDRRFRD